MKLKGAIVAMATPFREDGTIHKDTLRRVTDFLIERKVDGIFAASTVGEFVHLSARQRHELVALTAEYAAGRVPVLGGASDLSPARVIDHCREFKRAGAGCATIAPPYYYAMTQEDILAHYHQVAESIELPFVLYHIPQCSNRMTVETMLEAVRSCGPVALKNSNTDVLEMMALLEGLKTSGITYLVGPDELLFTGLELGAAGCMSGLAGTVPEAVRRLIDSYRAGDIDLARRIQFSLLELLKLVGDIPFPACVKLMLSARGFDMGPPVHAQSPATRERIERRKPEVTRKITSILQELGEPVIAT